MNTDYNRYQRQVQLKEIGQLGQDKINKAKVLIIGAGGLGCPALQYLAAAGVGTIGIIDFDTIEMSNLQRQILYTVDDLGKSKAITASIRLKALNPDIKINPYNFQITTVNAIEIIQKYDIVIDGSDNFSTRYLINDACVLLDKPLIYGAVLRFEGQVGVFNLANSATKNKTSYRDLFPKPPSSTSLISCNDVGVLGVIPGIIGTMQATEALKIISCIGEPLVNKVLTFNALENTFYDFEVFPDLIATKDYPKSIAAFLDYNYDWFCNPLSSDATITIEEFERLRLQEKITIIDVRERGEMPLVHEFPFIAMPLSEFEDLVGGIAKENKVVVFCKSGFRSLSALKILKEKKPEFEVFSLQGGIENWKKMYSKTVL